MTKPKIPAVGDTVDRRYTLKRELASGGMGTVFEATHLFTGRRVAIKLLLPGHSPMVRERLLREGAAFSGAQHRGIVEVLDAGEGPDGEPFLVMEMLEGRSLEGILAARRVLPVDDVIQIGVELGEALGFAHARKLLHRDVKPGNVFVLPASSGGPRVKLIDFGIVSVPEGTDGPGFKITQDTELIGTPEYMSPEQLRREPLDARSDLYGLGVTLFECLTGEVPFVGNYGQLLASLVTSPTPPSLRAARPEVSSRVALVIERSIARKAGDRYADAFAFVKALREANGLAAPQSFELAGPLQELEGPQRRTFLRAPYGTPVRLVRQDQTIVDGRSEDISEGGLQVLTDSPVLAGERAQLRFALPTTGAIAKVGGVVRWAKPARGGKAAVGFEFGDVPAEVREAIVRYTRYMSTETAAAS